MGCWWASAALAGHQPQKELLTVASSSLCWVGFYIWISANLTFTAIATRKTVLNKCHATARQANAPIGHFA